MNIMDCTICKLNKKLKASLYFSVINQKTRGAAYMCRKCFKVYGMNKKGHFIKLSNTKATTI